MTSALKVYYETAVLPMFPAVAASLVVTRKVTLLIKKKYAGIFAIK